MLNPDISHGGKAEELLAEVAEAASRVTRRHGAKGAFIDIELDIWYALQSRLRGLPTANPPPQPRTITFPEMTALFS